MAQGIKLSNYGLLVFPPTVGFESCLTQCQGTCQCKAHALIIWLWALSKLPEFLPQYLVCYWDGMCKDAPWGFPTWKKNCRIKYGERRDHAIGTWRDSILRYTSRSTTAGHFPKVCWSLLMLATQSVSQSEAHLQAALVKFDILEWSACDLAEREPRQYTWWC
jgi:hypothetical protein